MNELDRIVKKMLETHTGGEVFFDHLDEAIRNNIPVVEELLKSIPDIEDKNIILSGNFGQFFRKYLSLIEVQPRTIIWVPGGLRKDRRIDLTTLGSAYWKEFIFIDDSFYSGKTKNVIDRELNKCSSYITDTYVVYDGSHKKQENVHSLYRYHKEDK